MTIQFLLIVFLNYFVAIYSCLNVTFARRSDSETFLMVLNIAYFDRRFVGVDGWKPSIIDEMVFQLVVDGFNSQGFSPESIVRSCSLEFAKFIVDGLTRNS